MDGRPSQVPSLTSRTRYGRASTATIDLRGRDDLVWLSGRRGEHSLLNPRELRVIVTRSVDHFAPVSVLRRSFGSATFFSFLLLFSFAGISCQSRCRRGCLFAGESPQPGRSLPPSSTRFGARQDVRSAPSDRGPNIRRIYSRANTASLAPTAHTPSSSRTTKSTSSTSERATARTTPSHGGASSSVGRFFAKSPSPSTPVKQSYSWHWRALAESS